MKKYMKIIKDGIIFDNPVLIQVIGICSSLAVTNNMTNSLIMGVALMFSTAFSSLLISLLKDVTPKHIRMVVQVFVISFFVIIVDIVLRAYMPDVSKTLGAYVGLIITNCIIMGRAEGFAISNKPIPSFLDGLAAGLGYTLVLLAVSFFREILGFGSIFGFRIMPEGFVPWTMMVMPPGAFFILPIIMWIVYNAVKKKQEGGAK